MAQTLRNDINVNGNAKNGVALETQSQVIKHVPDNGNSFSVCVLFIFKLILILTF